MCLRAYCLKQSEALYTLVCASNSVQTLRRLQISLEVGGACIRSDLLEPPMLLCPLLLSLTFPFFLQVGAGIEPNGTGRDVDEAAQTGVKTGLDGDLKMGTRRRSSCSSAPTDTIAKGKQCLKT